MSLKVFRKKRCHALCILLPIKAEPIWGIKELYQHTCSLAASASFRRRMNIQVSRWCASAKPFLSVVFLQFGLAGMDILSKAALNQGMSNYVLVVYRHAVATIVIAPFALIFDKYCPSLPLRFLHWHFIKQFTCMHEVTLNIWGFSFHRKVRPKMTIPVFAKLIVLSLLEYYPQHFC